MFPRSSAGKGREAVWVWWGLGTSCVCVGAPAGGGKAAGHEVGALSMPEHHNMRFPGEGAREQALQTGFAAACPRLQLGDPAPGVPGSPPITVWVLTVLSSLCRLQVHVPPAVPQPHPAGLPPARPRAALTREHPRASLQPGTPGSPWWWSPCGAQPHLSETCFLLPKGLTGEVLSQAD